MLILSPPLQEVAARLARRQQETGSEHYWAVDEAGRIYKGRGDPGRVVADPDLETAYNDPAAELRYHHSHPDERALSPTDLGLLARAGVREVWAHSVGGSSYGVTRAVGMNRTDFGARLDQLHGHMLPEIIQVGAPSVTEDDFETFRDLAACEALDCAGLIVAHIRLSDEMRRTFLRKMDRHVAIRSHFIEALAR